jgi:hypothetical protein
MNPSEIDQSLVSLNFDIEKATNYFHSNPTKNKIAMGSFKYDDTPLLVSLVGRCGSDKIYVSAFDGKSNFSVPMEFEDAIPLKQLFEDLAAKVSETVPDYDINNPLARENFWLRLNFDHRTKKFKTKSNIALTNAKSAEKVVGLKDKEIKAVVEVKGWFNLADKKAGVSLNVLEVDFS